MDILAPVAARVTRGELVLSAAYLAPAGETEQRLLALWESIFHVDGIGVADDLSELAGDSLATSRLLAGIERDFGRTLPLADLVEYPTIRQLAARLDQLRLLAGERPLVAIRITGRRPPLFVVHAAPGDVFFARRLLAKLDPEQPLYGVQARGLESDETPHVLFEAMADDYLAAIRKVQPHGPYFLGGYCIGGLIAMVMSQRLLAEGENVALLFMIDPDFHFGAVPWLHYRNPGAPHIRLMLAMYRAAWPLRQFRSWLARGASRATSAAVPSVNVAEARRQRAVWAGMRKALRSFKPTPYDGDITIFCSTERRARLDHVVLGWKARARHVSFVEVAPTHRDLFWTRMPILSNHLQILLDRSQGISPPTAT
jgi:oxalate---CoA ligase